LAVVLVTIGTRAYEAGGSVAPFAAILSKAGGGYGAMGTARVAVFIIFGGANEYTTGVSRLLYAVAQDGGLPHALDHLHPKTKVPDRVLIGLLSSYAIVLIVYYFSTIDLTTALLVPSGAAILVYVVGSAAGVKILGRQASGSRMNLLLPLASLVISLIVMPFIGPLLTASLAVAAAALIYASLRRR